MMSPIIDRFLQPRVHTGPQLEDIDTLALGPLSHLVGKESLVLLQRLASETSSLGVAPHSLGTRYVQGIVDSTVVRGVPETIHSTHLVDTTHSPAVLEGHEKTLVREGSLEQVLEPVLAQTSSVVAYLIQTWAAQEAVSALLLQTAVIVDNSLIEVSADAMQVSAQD
jgi:hypothetical protein